MLIRLFNPHTDSMARSAPKWLFYCPADGCTKTFTRSEYARRHSRLAHQESFAPDDVIRVPSNKSSSTENNSHSDKFEQRESTEIREKQMCQTEDKGDDDTSLEIVEETVKKTPKQPIGSVIVQTPLQETSRHNSPTNKNANKTKPTQAAEVFLQTPQSASMLRVDQQFHTGFAEFQRNGFRTPSRTVDAREIEMHDLIFGELNCTFKSNEMREQQRPREQFSQENQFVPASVIRKMQEMHREEVSTLQQALQNAIIHGEQLKAQLDLVRKVIG